VNLAVGAVVVGALAPAPPRIPPATAAAPPAPGLGVSQEAHLVSPGPFLTRHASHFHSPGFLNLDMSKPPNAGAGVAAAAAAAPIALVPDPPLGPDLAKEERRGEV